MKVNRQQVLLGVLILTGVLRAGDFVLSSMIQGPLQELRGDNSELQETIEKQEKLLAEARTAGQRIEAWQQRSLPFDTETARSLYRNWLLDIVRQAKLRAATVDSDSRQIVTVCIAMPPIVQAWRHIAGNHIGPVSVRISCIRHRIVNLRITLSPSQDSLTWPWGSKG
ncbi:MAG: hypothetical protein R3C20_21125 [Planctomycetaceae bacterium]